MNIARTAILALPILALAFSAPVFARAPGEPLSCPAERSLVSLQEMRLASHRKVEELDRATPEQWHQKLQVNLPVPNQANGITESKVKDLYIKAAHETADYYNRVTEKQWKDIIEKNYMRDVQFCSRKPAAPN